MLQLFYDNVIIVDKLTLQYIVETPCLKQLIEAYKKYKTTILGVQDVSDEMVSKYGIIQGKESYENRQGIRSTERYNLLYCR